LSQANLEVNSGEQLYRELWVSLASLLRSYTAAHGLNGDRQATVELGEDRITVRNGMLEFTEAGRLRSTAGEEEMDIVAEAWAREMMR
jgi:hypothetical protein